MLQKESDRYSKNATSGKEPNNLQSDEGVRSGGGLNQDTREKNRICKTTDNRHNEETEENKGNRKRTQETAEN